MTRRDLFARFAAALAMPLGGRQLTGSFRGIQWAAPLPADDFLEAYTRPLVAAIADGWDRDIVSCYTRSAEFTMGPASASGEDVYAEARRRFPGWIIYEFAGNEIETRVSLFLPPNSSPESSEPRC